MFPISKEDLPFSIRFWLITAVTIILLSVSTFSHAGKTFYRWKDDQGITHYGERPPKDRPYVTIDNLSNLKGSPPPQKSRISSTPKEAEPEASEEPEVNLKNPKNCRYAKDTLKTIRQNARVRIQENGSIRYLSQEEIKKKIAELKKLQREAC